MEREITDIPAIADDSLIAVAEQAEKRINAVKKIKMMALKVTNSNDWVDQNGRPYLQTSGAEKIARLFGISWRIEAPEYEPEDNGHFTYTVRGHFSFAGVTIEAIGSRSSKDGFFKRYGKDEKGERVELPVSEIDKADVKKAAYTNCIGNGITRLLGIRNLSWDELQAVGITPSARIEYGGKAGENNELRAKIGTMIMDMAGGDKEKAQDILEALTSFEASDGRMVKGKRSLKEVSDKALGIIYARAKEEYAEWKRTQQTTTEEGACNHLS